MKLQRLPKIEGSVLKCRVPSLWPTCISGERKTTFAKAYGIKVRCYGEHVGNTLRTSGTYWDLDENPLRTLKKPHSENTLGTREK